MTAIVATPPQVLLNEHTRSLHLETCPVTRIHPARHSPLFTNWASRDIGIAVTGRELATCGTCRPLTRLAAWEHDHPAAAEASALAAVIERHRFAVLDERDLQDQLEQLLAPARREVVLSLGGRVDLMVARIAVEVKVAGSTEALYRQVLRYSHSPEVAGVLIVTTKADHGRLPQLADEKPIRVAIARGVV